jgi:molybdate/tungstate transport system substrate-binding protein
VVSVLYAGSLVNLMEHGLGPAFEAATRYRFQGVAGGSVAIAHQIKDGLRRADVFISANPQVNSLLMGPANGDWVRWYVTFAESPLVIGYNPRSAFAAELKVAPWYDVLASPGFRLGRTDPAIDPKGNLTLELIDRAAQYYRRPDLRQAVLGASDSPNQVFPEETLVGRLQTGQLDAGFFYTIEAVEARIPYITLPHAIALKAEYTVTILRAAPNGPGARTFARFLLGPSGGALLAQHGLDVQRPRAAGDSAAVPDDVRPLLR